MPELRIDPIMGRKVLVAEDRAGRPNDFLPTGAGPTGVSDEVRLSQARAKCPFCAGHEHETPHSLLEIRDENGDWQVRVVPNKFPAMTCRNGEQPDELLRIESPSLGKSVFTLETQPAFGAHEVIIESPRHLRNVVELTATELALVLRVYRDRMHVWSLDGRMQHATLFKNSGNAAGASLEHVHSQLMALPFVPEVIQQELAGAERAMERHEGCIYCGIIDEELASRERLVFDQWGYVAFCANAGRQPYETWLLPKVHASRFELLTEQQIDNLAHAMHALLSRLEAAVPGVSYNMVLHSSPFERPGTSEGQGRLAGGGSDRWGECYHWHWELIPRLSLLAGVELGAGVFINSLSPERAAGFLRNAESKT